MLPDYLPSFLLEQCILSVALGLHVASALLLTVFYFQLRGKPVYCAAFETVHFVFLAVFLPADREVQPNRSRSVDAVRQHCIRYLARSRIHNKER